MQNEEEETHFSWVNSDKHVEEIDLIVFPGDAIFEAVHDKKNTFVLRFEMDDDRYFFWLQVSYF